MSLRRLLALAPVPALIAAGGLAGPASAAPVTGASPSLSVHAIFGGGTKDIRVGQTLIAIVRNGGGQKVRQICWDPAPIGRPACGAATTGAPALGGVQRVVATLSTRA